MIVIHQETSQKGGVKNHTGRKVDRNIQVHSFPIVIQQYAKLLMHMQKNYYRNLKNFLRKQ